MTRDHVRHNREFWDADADAYQEAHGAALDRAPMAWGAFRVAERELNVLGPVHGCDVLELGCGAAQWSVALEQRGAHVVGLDVSRGQLTHAREASNTLPLLVASGEQLPFTDAAFDIVFCDHGALSFCDPDVIVPETARVLRSGGRLAFSVTHPLLYLTWNQEKEQQTRTLHMDFADLGPLRLDEGTFDWALSTSAWIRVLTSNGFDIVDCIELVAAPKARTTYKDYAPTKWARRWPAEWIWKARKR